MEGILQVQRVSFWMVDHAIWFDEFPKNFHEVNWGHLATFKLLFHGYISRWYPYLHQEYGKSLARHSLESLLDHFPWTYIHVGVELKLDHRCLPFLKQNLNPAKTHKLEGSLPLFDGFESLFSLLWYNANQDVALVNKASNMLRSKLMVLWN